MEELRGEYPHRIIISRRNLEKPFPDSIPGYHDGFGGGCGRSLFIEYLSGQAPKKGLFKEGLILRNSISISPNKISFLMREYPTGEQQDKLTQWGDLEILYKTHPHFHQS